MNKKISIIHQNVQSIGNSVDAINMFLSEHSDCICLAITEHWKSTSQLQLHGINDFKLVSSFCREEGQHGGVAVFCRNSVKCKARKNLNELSVCSEFECAASELFVNNQNIVIVSVYRPPNGSIELFLDKLEQLLTTIFAENKLTFIAGDFNIELKDNNKHLADISMLLNSFSFSITINEYTRITHNTKSCIDNIFTNYEYEYQTNILHSFISDHTAQKITFSLNLVEESKHTYRRFFSEHNKNNFILKLQEQTWNELYQFEEHEINKQWNYFMNIFLIIFNESFPLTYYANRKNKKFNIITNPKIKECKTQLDILLVLSKSDKKYTESYNLAKKKYNNLLAKERSETYENRIKMSDNKNKCMWSIHDEITGKKHKNEIQVTGCPAKIAEDYNNYLLNIVPDLLDEAELIQFNCNIEQNRQSMFVKPINEHELIELSERLKNKYTSGEDEIPNSIIKLCIKFITKPVCFVINNSFKYGVFPEQLKLALIKPLYKKGNPELLENHRPISILPSFSKLFEMAMCDRVMSFLTSCQLISRTQHGYIKGRSIETAIFQFTNYILESFEKNNISLGIFLDLSKAYDCLNHDYLLIKLEMYGIRGNALEWFKSYLSCRSQRVVVEKDGKKHKSAVKVNSIGVPQGSITGPILFLIYMNDLCNIIKVNNHHVTNYADDSNLLIVAKDYPQLLKESNNLFSEARTWFSKNSFLLNVEKTNILLFRTKQLQIETPNKIKISDKNIEVSRNVKFLGIHIDEHLDMSAHIEYLCPKLNKICYSIRVIHKYLNEKSLRIIYFANFESIIKFGIIFWGSNTNINKIFVIQKRVLRLIYKMQYNESCRTIFKNNKILTVVALYIYEILIFVFKNKEIFEITNVSHNYATRTLNINYPVHRLRLTEKSPYYMGIRLYNSLPQNLKLIKNIKKFKNSIRNLLINIEPYNINEYFSH